MRARLVILSLVTGCSFFLAAPAFAAFPPVSIDEVNNNLTNTSGIVTPGYLLLCEGPVSTTGPGCGPGVTLSDLVVFTTNSVTLLSDKQDGADAPADLGFPTLDPTLLSLTLTEPVNENGVETLVYTANCPDDPGSVTSGPVCFSATYNITSDSPSPVPEPSTVLLVSSGVASVIALRRRPRSAPA